MNPLLSILSMVAKKTKLKIVYDEYSQIIPVGGNSFSGQ